MQKLEIDHIGYAVSDIDKSMRLFLELGFKMTREVLIDRQREVKIAFIKMGDINIELISPLNDKSPISSYLNKIGNTPYHICYRVDNLSTAIDHLRQLRFKVIEKANKAVALENSNIAFLYHADYGLLELFEKKNI